MGHLCLYFFNKSRVRLDMLRNASGSFICIYGTDWITFLHQKHKSCCKLAICSFPMVGPHRATMYSISGPIFSLSRQGNFPLHLQGVFALLVEVAFGSSRGPKPRLYATKRKS